MRSKVLERNAWDNINCILSKCFANNVEERYSDEKELLREIQNIHERRVTEIGGDVMVMNAEISQNTNNGLTTLRYSELMNNLNPFLRRLGISYIIAGSDSLDYEQTLSKLKEQFGIENLMLGGGAALNWSFIQAGMCDEVSVVIAAVADGSANTQTLFMTREGMSDDTPVAFKLQEAKVMDGDSIWLRYLVKNVKEN